MVAMDYFLGLMILIFSHQPMSYVVEAKISGFSLELIHHDSQLSPFYNHSATPGELSSYDALRSIARINHFRPSSVDGEKIESLTIPNGGGYLMRISIGNPPVESLATADTGSDLVWIQCAPCDNCYPQDSPIFDPVKSSTYMDLPCDSSPCQALPLSQCGNTNNECQYRYDYGDRSYTVGVLSTDTFTFDSTNAQATAFPNSVFGCGHDNAGTFTSRGSGLVGLGGGPLSLISQLSAEIEQKFSYCLLPRTANSASKLKFGKDAIISGEVVSTPISQPRDSSSNTFYSLTLQAVSIGSNRIPYSQREGNIIIDSGTTLTILESNFYNELEAAVKESISLSSTVQDPRGNYRLCYDSTSFSTAPETPIIFQFTGADITLKTINTFVVLDGITCLAIIPSNGLNIFGNVAQINFQVGYDLAKKQVSFAPADCTQY
ncbi:unnamed protein product [Ilex paraguariensis]|uniref:Peptidase A1 domain-containing protein n=1 Tax=Ilex paraguariensis TaxID=185542 RepID=A0ABC8T8E1_9AQUA